MKTTFFIYAILLSTSTAFAHAGLDWRAFDWRALASIKQSATSAEQAKRKYHEYLASTQVVLVQPVTLPHLLFTTPDEVIPISDSDRLQVIEQIDPLLIDAAIEELIVQFPFPGLARVGCSGILCKDSLYRVNTEDWDSKIAGSYWQIAESYLNGWEKNPPHKDFKAYRAALSGLVLIRFLLDIEMPFEKWGTRPADSLRVLDAVAKTFQQFFWHPNAVAYVQNPTLINRGLIDTYPSWPLGYGNREANEAVETIRWLQRWRKQLQK